MSKIISIGTAVPAYETSQETILNYMRDAYKDDVASRKLQVLFNQSGIKKRYSVIPDFGSHKGSNVFFTTTASETLIEKRLEAYKKEALPLAVKAINNAFNKLDSAIEISEITHLITVSCTGLYAPGLNVDLIQHLNLKRDIQHTSVNFLGCNAAFYALKTADLIAQTDQNAKVLMVCVELCTLHFQAKNNNDNLLSNTLFGDGAAAAIITSGVPEGFKNQSLSIEGFYSLLLDKGKDLMEWNITPLNFEMVLSSKLPQLIGDEIGTIMNNFRSQFKLPLNGIQNYAVHPGGKKILDAVHENLHLDEDDLSLSYKVLNQYGNMSSPTILFILNEFLNQKNKSNETLFAVGFGPGITIETALLKYD